MARTPKGYSKATFAKQFRLREIVEGAHAAYLAAGVAQVKHLDLNGGAGRWLIKNKFLLSSSLILGRIAAEHYPEFEGYTYETDLARAQTLSWTIRLFGLKDRFKVVADSNKLAVQHVSAEDIGLAYHDPCGNMDMDLLTKLAAKSPGMDVLMNVNHSGYKRQQEFATSFFKTLDKQHIYVSEIMSGWSFVLASNRQYDLPHLYTTDSVEGQEIMHVYSTTHKQRNNAITTIIT